VQANERDADFREVQQAWIEYQSLVDSIASDDLERPMTVGTWSGRDVVAHIANWEEHCAGLIQRWDAGEPKTWIDEFDVNDMARWDIWNEEYVSRFRSMSMAEIRAYARSVHEELMPRAAASSVVTGADLRAMTSGHYDVHRDDLLHLKSLDLRSDD
jgi:hypothetical protein